MRNRLRRAHFLLVLGLVVGLVLAAIPAAAQSSTGQSSTGGGKKAVGPGTPGAAAQAPVTNPAIVPGEPQIVMPEVILRVEDLSVETVEAQLPPEEDLLPPVRPVPLLTEGEMAVGEPTIPAAPVETEGPAPSANQRLLSSDIRLGAGTLALISGSMSLKTLGPDPRFSLQFHHETLDGFGGHAPGSGYNTRDDGLDGGLKFALGGVGTELAGNFREQESGLQGQSTALSPYSSALTRTISGSASFSGSPLDWLTLSASAAGGLDSLTLQGASPLLSSEVRVAPSLSAQARVGAVVFGLESDYWYRADWYLAGAQDQLHRVKAALTFRADLPATFVIQASAGWFWNSTGLSRFPFFLSVTGTPLEFLTLSIEGGYKVVPYDMQDAMAANVLALPQPLVDDRGWYGESSAKLSVTRDLSVTVNASFMASEEMPVGSTSRDTTTGTGLFPVSQGSGNRLSLNGGLRWAITQAFSISAGGDYEFLDPRPFFTPLLSVNGGILGLDPNGRFGGSLTVSAGPIADGTFQQPLLHASAFWRIIEAVKLQIDGDDLLAPLIGGPRYAIAKDTYVTPGFRLTASLGMSL